MPFPVLVIAWYAAGQWVARNFPLERCVPAWYKYGLIMKGTHPNKNDRGMREARAARIRSALSVTFGCLTLLLSGCAEAPSAPTKRFTEILYRYPQAQEPLQFPMLSAASAAAVASALPTRTVTIVVHPAYSLFFRDERRNTYSEAKYDLLKFQLDNEARFMSEFAKSGNLLILILPGKYQKDSIAPLSYTFYLNATTAGGTSVFYLYSETWSSGTLSVDAVLTLHDFLSRVKPNLILVGGGFIGRCQREFYNQLVTYIEKQSSYIVPEISTISPDDITDQEAADILASVREKDYTPVKKFIEKKTRGDADILPVSPDAVL